MNLNGTMSRYGYGKDFDNDEGIIELDISKHTGNEITDENGKDMLFEIKANY
ncbi:hypothetical protein GCM10023310_19750 [Paenibacillus vulneris]